MRAAREDYPGADWIITNRGIAKRAVFETAQDFERISEELAAAVELGLIEVHAFVFMTTHFHLLLRSLTGEISRSMKLVTNAFVRWFNRARRRDGPLFATRFHGRRIEDAAYWEAALRYIDLNPVRAGFCSVPSDHPLGSARAYRYELGPSWLSRARVIGMLEQMWAPVPFTSEHYDEFACTTDPQINAYLMERMASRPGCSAPPLTDLIRTASLRQQGWMEWKAALADGMQVGTAFLPPEEARRAARVVARQLVRMSAFEGMDGAERELAAGLLRASAGRTVTEIAADLGVARSTAHVALKRYDTWMRMSPRYSDLVARALQGAMRRVFPLPRSPLELPHRAGM